MTSPAAFFLVVVFSVSPANPPAEIEAVRAIVMAAELPGVIASVVEAPARARRAAMVGFMR
jgi:hypothetical protein